MTEDDPVPRFPRHVGASPARMYDYYLGGKHNYQADRDAADAVIDAHPEVPLIARNNRRFLCRAVRFMAEDGIDQFVDLGAGMPTAPSPQETARRIHPRARIVNVDEDPVVLCHCRARLAHDDGIGVVDGDMLCPEQVLAAPELTGVVDLSRPVGLLAVAVFHFAPVDVAREVVSRYRDRLAPGSWLALSAVTSDGLAAEEVEAMESAYADATRGLTVRSRAEITALFDGFSLAEPGIVDVAQWRPAGGEPGPRDVLPRVLAGVAQRP